MAAPEGLRTVQKFAKTLDRSFVEAKAAEAKDIGATAAEITDDGTDWVLTVDWPPPGADEDMPAPQADTGAAPPATAHPNAAPATAAAPAGGGNQALGFAEAVVQHWEGCSLTVYHGKADRPDVWTIGWGSISIDGKPVNPSTPPITQARADELLAKELSVTQAAVKKLITVSLTGFQEAALISFTYNLGAGALGTSTLRTLLNEGHVDAAAGEFLKWVHSNGQRIKGLIRRRGAEQAVFEGKVPFGAQLPKTLDQFADAALAANPV